MLPKTLISIDAMPCTASASHANATGPPQGPIYLPLGHTPSTSVNTKSDRDTHDALVSLLHTRHSHILILDLVRVFGHGTF